MRRKIVAGNWKMHNDVNQTISLIDELANKLSNHDLKNVSVMVAPTFVNLYVAKEHTKGTKIEVIAQNLHFEDKGAFTGEVSADMLKSIGLKTVIIGHSERRTLFHEDNDMLKKKVDKAISKGMEVIFCIGETLEEREAGKHFDVLKKQLDESLFQLSGDEFAKIIIAYEPVWAIGTGKTATPEQAQEIHNFIREVISEKYSSSIAEQTPILYGGSVKADNAKEIFSKKDVDGGLVGGASLKADDFFKIIDSY